MFPRRVRPPSAGEKTPDEPVPTTTPRTAQAEGEFIGYDFPRSPARTREYPVRELADA
jgi:hypothetical protein